MLCTLLFSNPTIANRMDCHDASLPGPKFGQILNGIFEGAQPAAAAAEQPRRAARGNRLQAGLRRRQAAAAAAAAAAQEAEDGSERGESSDGEVRPANAHLYGSTQG